MKNHTLTHAALTSLPVPPAGIAPSPVLDLPARDRSLYAIPPLAPAIERVSDGRVAAVAAAEWIGGVAIIGGSRIHATALQRLLADEPDACRTRIIAGPYLTGLDSAPAPEVALIAPVDWRQIATWLPKLRRHLAMSPWLLLADLRLAGMFLSFFESHAAAVIEPDARPEELRSAVRSVADQHRSHLPTELLSLFARRLGRPWNGRRPRLPSMIEIQCACAVSLGLCNREIAEALYLGESTIKSHLHRLMGRLQLSSRSELDLLVKRALTR